MTSLVDLDGKRGLIVGIGHEHSIAAGCAEAFTRWRSANFHLDQARSAKRRSLSPFSACWPHRHAGGTGGIAVAKCCGVAAPYPRKLLVRSSLLIYCRLWAKEK